MSCHRLNSPYFSSIFRKRRDFSAYFFFSPQNHKRRLFKNGWLSELLNLWVQYCLRQLEISHSYEQDVWLHFWVKTFFSKSTHYGWASNESSVYLILRILVFVLSISIFKKDAESQLKAVVLHSSKRCQIPLKSCHIAYFKMYNYLRNYCSLTAIDFHT